jgi:hypothetical protein
VIVWRIAARLHSWYETVEVLKNSGLAGLKPGTYTGTHIGFGKLLGRNWN